MQAQYVTSLEGDLTDEELIETYGLTAQSIAEARLRAALYEMALAVDLPPDVKAKVNDPREFPLTNLERVVEMKEGRQFLGVTLDPKHGVQGVVPKEEFEKGFRKLVADVANGVVTSRTTNKGEEVRRYFETYPDECRPNTNRRGSFLPSDIVGQASPPSASTKPPATPSSRAPRQAKSILGPDVKCTVNDARIQDIFKEIKKLRIVDHPNASALMVRTLLELAVIRYLKKRGEIAAMKAEIQKKQTSNIPRDWHPELRPMLKRLLGDQTLPLDGQERRALRKLAEERDSPVTLDSLNAFVHSPLDTPVERELRAISVKLKPLFAILLNDK